MDARLLGRWMMGAGALLLVLGLVAYFGGLSWFGRLPGDVRLEGGSTRVYIPWVSMLLVSLVLGLLASLLRRLL